MRGNALHFGKIRAFLENDDLKTMFGQTEVSFDFRTAIDVGWIVLVNLSQDGDH